MSETPDNELSRRKIEQAEREWENIFESIGDPVLILNSDHKVIDINKAALSEFRGSTKSEFIGKNCFEIYHRSNAPIQNCPLERLKSSLKSETLECEMEMLGGWFLITAAPVFDESGKITKIIHIAKNITERKRSETALRESEARFHGIVDNAQFGVVIHKDGEILFANRMAYRILGYDIDEEIGKNIIDFVAPEDRDDVIKARSLRVKGIQVTDRRRINLSRKDGKTVVVEAGLSIIPYKGETAEIVAFIDVTEEADLREQLIQAQKMEAIGRLAGGVAHDFNNLLTAITGYAELLMAQLDEDDANRERVLDILKTIEKATTLTGQLLMFGRRKAAKRDILDLNRIVVEIERLLKHMLGVDVELKTHPRDGLWKVRADKTRIEQVIMNLAINARDAMGKGGILTIETANAELDEEYCKRHLDVKPGRYALLAVSDTGAGMDEETKRRAFDPFFTTKEPGKGTGLGLSTVYGIIQQFDGYVRLYSEPGIGTTFKIYLPSAEGVSEVASPEQPLPTQMPKGNETIFLAEDDDVVRELAVRILESLGYKVIAASNGEEALQKEAEYHDTIHMLLTDLVMPKMGGVELIKNFVPRRPGVKLLCVTGYSEEGVSNNGILRTGAALLQKPYTALVFAVKVREILDS